MDTIVLPANRIERATHVMAMRYRVASIVMVVLAVVLLVLGVWSQYGARPLTHEVSDSLVMFTLMVVVPVAFAFLIRRRARRIAWIGAQAAADPTIMWLVDDYRVLATDEFGTPRPELAFKVTPQLRTELTGAATATLR